MSRKVAAIRREQGAGRPAHPVPVLGTRAVSVSGRLILVSGIGSALGPLLGAATMEAFGVGGLFGYMAAVAALFALFALARGLSVRAPLFKRRRPFLLLPAIFAHDLAHASQERAR